MRPDVAFIEAHDSFRQDGIEERAIRLPLRAGSTFGVVYEPLRDPRPTGFVLCHSFGFEHLTLRRLEVQMARALARDGFPAMTYEVPGGHLDGRRL